MPSIAQTLTLPLPLLILAWCIPTFHPALGQTNPPRDTDKARITGTVVDEARRPVKGAVVHPSKTPKETALTDDDGQFVLNLDSATVNYVKVIARSADGALAGVWEDTAEADANISTSIHAEMMLKSAVKIPVTVTNSDKSPVSGAAVAVVSNYTTVGHGETDATGRAILSIPAGEGKITVVALKAGVGLDYQSVDLPAPNQSMEDATLILDGASKFEVRATDSAGQPVGGVQYVPWAFKKSGRKEKLNTSGMHQLLPLARTTDSRGIATFDFLPANIANGVSMLCISEDLHQPKDPYWTMAIAAQHQGAEPLRLDTVVKQLSPLKGKVSYPDGSPAAGILLQAEGKGATNHYCRKRSRTKKDGTFEFHLYPDQSYLIAVMDRDWAAPSVRGLLVKEGQPCPDLAFILGEGVVMQGTVTNPATKSLWSGQMVTVIEQGALLKDNGLASGPEGKLDDTPETLVRWARTDSEGRYSIRLGRGTYRVSGPGRSEELELVLGDLPVHDQDF